MRYDNDSDEIMRDVRSSLAHQVQDEIEEPRAGKSSKKKKKRGLGLIKALLIALLLVIGVCVFFIFTKPGRKLLIHFATEYAYSKIDFEGEEEIEAIHEGEVVYYPNVHMEQMTETFKEACHEEGVVNVLLLGVEAIGYDISSGHTDAIIIATMNKNTNTISLTSLLRDSWVKLPDGSEGRINTAYAKGGIEGLYETIATNYDLRIDGYVLVGFDAFEKLIDALGGVDIELTEEEAKYLNKTNYISEKKNRTMVPGMQHMNGNQALGYCRVRKIATLDGSNYDMGRTSRQRRVLNAVFNKIKTDNIGDLVNVMNTVLPIVQTDIRKTNCKNYLADAIDIGLASRELIMQRLPQDGEYDATTINKASVLVPHWDETKEALHKVVFEGVVEKNK